MQGGFGPSSPTLADIKAAKDFWEQMEKEIKEKDKNKSKPKRGSYEWSLEKRYNVWHLTFWLIILSPLIGPAVSRWVTEIAPAILR